MTQTPEKNTNKHDLKDELYFRYEHEDDFLQGEMGPENRIYPEARKLIQRLKSPIRQFFHKLALFLHLKRRKSW